MLCFDLFFSYFALLNHSARRSNDQKRSSSFLCSNCAEKKKVYAQHDTEAVVR